MSFYGRTDVHTNGRSLRRRALCNAYEETNRSHCNHSLSSNPKNPSSDNIPSPCPTSPSSDSFRQPPFRAPSATPPPTPYGKRRIAGTTITVHHPNPINPSSDICPSPKSHESHFRQSPTNPKAPKPTKPSCKPSNCVLNFRHKEARQCQQT